MKKMSEFGSVDEVLSYAIEKEQEAHDFYHDLAGKVDKRWVKDLLEDFAKEELGHKEKLARVRDGKILTPSPKQVADLKISDYLVEVSPRPDMDVQDVLMVAMQREKASFRLLGEWATWLGWRASPVIVTWFSGGRVSSGQITGLDEVATPVLRVEWSEEGLEAKEGGR